MHLATAKPLGRIFRALRVVVRAVWLFAISFSIAFGFIAGAEADSPNYDPYLFAIGASAMFAVACVALALLNIQNRLLRRKVRLLTERVEELADRNWELREAEERARRFLEAQGDVIVRRAADGRITYANDAFCTLAGIPREALVGSDVMLPVREQGPASQLPEGGRIHDQQIAAPEGARWIAWREAMVRTDAPEMQSVGRDITDRVETQRALADARDAAQAASRAKSRFLAMVSHEIRTPLNGMLGMTELLLDTPLTAEQMTYAKAAKASGDTLLSLIAEILDLAKIEAGKLVLEPHPFAPQALIEEVVELLSPRAHAKGLEIAGYVDSRLPPRLRGDATRLRQILLNLAGNAAKFTDTGGLAVIVEPGEGSSVRFTVRDTGIGIAPEVQARIFDEFEQGGDNDARTSGTGLGLAICRGLAERMGGTIAVVSAPGAGATFTLTVPLPASDTDAGPAPALAGTRVLIVSPGPFEAALLARRCGDWGAVSRVERDAARASARIASEAWDVLLVDAAIGMQEARALAAAASAIARRIVLLTPAARQELAGLTAAGFTGYLVQPVRLASLAARLAPGAPERAAFAKAAPDHAAPAGGRSVLVAEDNEINGLLARALLAKLGHRPTVVTDGAAAIAAWHEAQQSTPFDLVLMDVHMPGLDGLAATRRIRALEMAQGLTQTPIIALTANAFAEDREACLAAGMTDFLTKPLERERLGDLLAALPRASLAA